MNTLQKVIKWGIYLSILMPLVIFNQYISPFHFGKVVLFRAVIEILAVLYLILVFRDRSFLPRRTPLLIAIGIFTFAFGLVTFTSVNIYQSFWGTLERMGGWFTFLHFVIFFILLSVFLRKKEDWITLFRISLFVCLLSIFYGLLQKTSISWVLGSGGRNKIFGTIGNAALFAGYVIINTFLALMLSFISGTTSGWKWFYRAMFALGFIAVILTGVRGSVIGLIAGIIIFGMMYAFYLNAKRARMFTLIFSVLIVAGGLILLLARNTSFVQKDAYLARYSDFSLSSYTVQTRFWVWKAGFQGMTDSAKAAIVGYGPENFNIPFSKHFNPLFFKGPGSETLFDRAHNQFLEVLFTMGIIGFLAYIFIFVRAFQLVKRSEMPQSFGGKSDASILRAGIVSALVAYIIHNSFIFDTSANYLMFFIMLGFINFLYLMRREESGEKVLIRQPKAWMKSGLAWTLGIIVFIPVIWLIYFSDIETAKANRTTTWGLAYVQNDQPENSYSYFDKALNYDVPGKYDFRNRYAQVVIDQTLSSNLTDAETQRIQTAIDYEKKNVQESPQDYLPLLYLSRLYIILGKNDPNSPYNDQALNVDMKALSIAPNFIRTYYEVAQAYINKRQDNKAIEYFQKAVDLNPGAGISWWYLGVSLYDTGQKEQGLAALDKMYETGYIPDTQSELSHLIQVYLDEKNYQKVLYYYMHVADMNPNSAQVHANLAAVYAQLGDLDNAVKEAHIAVQLDSKFETEAKKFVQTLGRQW